MKIINPSYEILKERPYAEIMQQIEERGRICYKSEDKITETSAPKFVDFVIKKKHSSVLEMAQIHVKALIPDDIQLPKFLRCHQGIVSGSVRAWRECSTSIHPGFKESFPGLFDDLATDSVAALQGEIHFITMPENDLVHTWVAVKLITNRAVTHEIVRHRPCSFLQESQRYCRYDKDQFGNEVTFIRPMLFGKESLEYAYWHEAMLYSEERYLKLLDLGASPQEARTVLPNSCKTEIIVYANLAEWRHIFYQRTSSAAEPSMRELMVPLYHDFVHRFPGHFEELIPSIGGN